MGQELHPSPSPATSRAPEERAGVQLVAVALFFAILVGAIFFLAFLASSSVRTLLYLGLGLFLVELASVIVLTAVGWSGELHGYPLVVFALSWLGWNALSGACLALYVFVATYPPSLLQGILLCVLGFAPMVVTVAVALLADMVRRWLVSRHVSRT